MIKNYLLIAFLAVSFQLFSQETYFLVGNNFTKYVFKSSEGVMTTQLQSGTGSAFEMGYSFPVKNEKIYYSIGLTLNDYNAVAGSQSESYQWETKYIGAQNAVSYNFTLSNNFQLAVKGGVNLSTLLYGKQKINGAVYDLKGQDEFSGLFLSPFAGIQTRYRLNDLGYLSLGYIFSKSLNPFNTSEEKLSFNTNQILFGIHFNINEN
ncbi:hypothetical protein FNW25_05780 [Flavobacterium franklandianum]|uniref:hypothetical protein n=1 Tax=Flavobacterium franklandianum TaxID=2594430 RepID=UPI001179C3AE|nr:hypothetical protein [Flavobacterium franklandianum]TRX27769.1 hypothetical protein FNW25_05780 [Flavobacterium franklandianum]